MDKKIKKVFVVFKTHFDIGYTHLAKELLAWYSHEMIKDVAEVCMATRNKPEGRKYVWTVPSWPLKKTVEGIVEPELKDLVEKLIEEGQLIWHGLPYTTHTEFCGMEEFIRGLYVARELSQKYNRWTTDAKMTDVPGHTWILPSILAKAGIKFMHIGSNFCATPPDVPRLFYWEGPDGNRVLTYYSKGDYGTDLIPPKDWDYPYWLAMLQTLDNLGAQDTNFLDAMFERAKIELPETEVSIGSLEDFGKAMLEGDFEIPVVRGDLADTWIRGVGSAPFGVSKVRVQRPLLSVLESVTAMCRMNDLYANEAQLEEDKMRIAQSYEKMLLFGEHTWSMDSKVTILPERRFGEPWIGFKFWESGIYDKKLFEDLKNNDSGYLMLQESWQEQLDYLSEADKGIMSINDGALRALAEAVDIKGERLVIVNALGWKSKRQVTLEGIVPANKNVEYLMEPVSGEKVPVYLNHEGKMCTDINLNALGYKTMQVFCSARILEKSYKVVNIANLKSGCGLLENDYLKIEVDNSLGVISSFYHKVLDKEWVNKKSELGFGQYVYDIFSNKELQQYLCDYSYVLRDWGVNDYGKAGYPKDQQHQRFTYEEFDIKVENGYNWGKIILSKNIDDESTRQYGNAVKLQISIVLYQDSEYVDLSFDLFGKQQTPLIEAGHIAFPLELEGAKYSINKMGSVVDPERNIISGCNRDLHCLDKWVDISDGNCGMAIIPHDMPLFSFCEPGVLKFDKNFTIKEPTLLMQNFNNAWGTNFPQWIGGDLSYRYRLVPHKGNWKDGDIWKMAEETLKEPRAVYSNKEFLGSKIPHASEIIGEGFDSFAILALKVAEDNSGYIVRFNEISGESSKVKIRLGIIVKELWECDLVERKNHRIRVYSDNKGSIFDLDTKPFEIHTLFLQL